jgi:3-hydroxyisobutyrate dehydrogenase
VFDPCLAGAEAGTLTFMVGGSGEDVEAAKGVLQHMGKNIVHCGGPGTGGVAKICNNLVLGINMIGTCEAMNLGQKLGESAMRVVAITVLWFLGGFSGLGSCPPLIRIRLMIMMMMMMMTTMMLLLPGIDAKVLAGVLNTSSGRSWVTDLYAPVPGVHPNAPASKGYAGEQDEDDVDHDKEEEDEDGDEEDHDPESW